MSATQIRFSRMGCAHRTPKYLTRWGGVGVCPTLRQVAAPSGVAYEAGDRYRVFGFGFNFPGEFATVAAAKDFARAIAREVLALPPSDMDGFRAVIVQFGGTP